MASVVMQVCGPSFAEQFNSVVMGPGLRRDDDNGEST